MSQNQEIDQTQAHDGETERGHSEANAQPVQVYRPRPWLAVAISAGIGTVGIAGFSWVVWASSAFSDVSDGIKFLTEGSIAFALLLVAIVQACVYWSQRRIMTAQWDAMERSLEAVNKQEGHLSAQAEAAKTQATIMQGQLDAIKQQAVQDKIRFEYQTDITNLGILAAEKSAIYAQRAYVVARIRDTGIRDDALQFRLSIHNGGNTPANDVHVTLASELRESPPWSIMGHDESVETQIVFDIGYTQTERLGVIAPGSDQVIETPESGFGSPAEFKRFELGELDFYCWGRIVYEDMFDQRRHTDFCFVLSIEHTGGYPCEHGNHAI